MTIFIQPEINRFWIFLEAATLISIRLYCVVFVEWNKWINTSTIFVQIYSWVANLNNFVQIGQSLMLVHLCHAKLLDEQFFNIFELVNLEKIKRKKWENWKFCDFNLPVYECCRFSCVFLHGEVSSFASIIVLLSFNFPFSYE